MTTWFDILAWANAVRETEARHLERDELVLAEAERLAAQ